MSDVNTQRWGGAPFPPDVVQALLSKLLTGSPLANALTPAPTRSGQVIWPLVSPEGAAWVPELGLIPSANLNDETYTVAVAKIATIILLSNESIGDASFPIGQAVGRALADSIGPLIDTAFLYGTGPAANQPLGIWAAAPEADPAPDFRSAAIVSWGELAAAGAQVDAIVVAAHPTQVAGEWARTTGDGLPIHADAASGALTLGPGISVLPVPMMRADDVLAFDSSMLFRVIRDDVLFELNPSAAWDRDAASLRVKGRLTVAAPTPDKSLRKVTIGAAATAKAPAPAPAKK